MAEDSALDCAHFDATGGLEYLKRIRRMAYDTFALQRDCGQVTDFVAPKNPHPDSILWRSSYRPINEKGDILLEQIQDQKNPLYGHPYREWLAESDNRVVGRHLSTACYVEESVPSVLYLALKYYDKPEQGLIVNTNLGGDNVHRGVVLGSLLGAANALEAFPARWVKGLHHPPPDLDLSGPDKSTAVG